MYHVPLSLVMFVLLISDYFLFNSEYLKDLIIVFIEIQVNFTVTLIEFPCILVLLQGTPRYESPRFRGKFSNEF